ncbi:MAG: VCBS repeat-containing protein, partial [Acidobacteriaceae bacterium]|nr:VCBS repeat-containing protein [Acidobacteriaceae bacterium]
MDRRSFLIGGLTFPLLPRVHGENTPLVDSAFHLHPRYRAENPLDPIIQKVKPGADDFILETHHNGIAAILKQWNTALLTSRNFDAIATALSPAFLGCSLQPAGSRIIRSDPALEVEHISYAQKQTLNSNAFLNDLHAALSTFSKLFNAELQVTSIENQSPGILRTRIRYELIGSGKGFYREQRVGLWELEWEMTSGGTYRVRRWQAAGETLSRSSAEWYRDISGHSFGSTSSWSQQMLHGVDYWRAVLDGACGIDIYGHNGVSVGDIDNDGFDDVYICQPAGLPNRLYRNRGDGTFEDITEAAGVSLLDNTACALFLDIDNDGQQDLIVVRATGPLLFLNQGNCRFREMPGAFQFATPPQGTFAGAAAADYDRDGWLDIY